MSDPDTPAHRVVLVTGAGRGIGEAVARGLTGEGTHVALVDRDPDTVTALAGELTRAGHTVGAWTADVADPVEVDTVVGAVEKDLGPIEGLANVAGVLHPGRATEIDDEQWEETFAVNATGVRNTSRAVARHMIPRGRGAIVTVTSNAATVPRMGMAAYAASKAASTMFTKCLGLELAACGIRCNTVAPGSTDTPMLRALWTDGAEASAVDGVAEAYRVGIPLGRVARPVDVADAVLFLLSDASRQTTMHELSVDGGAGLGV